MCNKDHWKDMAEGSAVELNKIKEKMISKLAKTDAHFAHQQRGEPDLTEEQKAEIAMNILNRNPSLFLERFSQYMDTDDVAYFNEMKGDYVVDFYMDSIIKRCADTNQKMVKNRRYQALQMMMEEGDYFSEEEMKWRDPLLFEQMVGQYETEEEQANRDIDKTDLKFSSILLKHMDNQMNKEFYTRLKEQEEGQEEEEEESDDESEEEADLKETKNSTSKEREPLEVDDEEEGDSIPEGYRNQLRNEFLRTMQERFLSGQEQHFDYSTVDHNSDYDSLDILGHDAEEKYFDAEEPDGGVSLDDGQQRTWDAVITSGVEAMDLTEERTGGGGGGGGGLGGGGGGGGREGGGLGRKEEEEM